MYSLNEPPKPAMVWYTTVSSTTMSASPMVPGLTKLIGVDGDISVNRESLFHVVCHWGYLLAGSIQGSAVLKEGSQYLVFAEQQRGE